jgi:hypothetical protein
LITRMVGQNDVGDESSLLPTLSEEVDEQGIKCGIVIMQSSTLMQKNPLRWQ